MAIGDLQWEVGQPAGTQLISDIDGWVGDNNQALQRMFSYYRNGCGVEEASTTSVTIKAGQLMLTNGTNYRMRAITSSITASLASPAADTWYDIYAVADNATATTFTGEIVATGSSPSGTYTRKISMVKTNSSSEFIGFIHNPFAGTYDYKTYQTLASGSNSAGSWTSITTSTYVPASISKRAFGTVSLEGNSLMMANTTSAGTGTQTSSANRVNTFSQTGGKEFWWEFPILTANTLYWSSSTSTNKIYIAGFYITEHF